MNHQQQPPHLAKDSHFGRSYFPLSYHFVCSCQRKTLGFKTRFPLRNCFYSGAIPTTVTWNGHRITASCFQVITWTLLVLCPDFPFTLIVTVSTLRWLSKLHLTLHVRIIISFQVLHLNLHWLANWDPNAGKPVYCWVFLWGIGQGGV